MNTSQISDIQARDAAQQNEIKKEQIVYESAVFNDIFYSKRNMKAMLDQRNIIFNSLKITLQKKKPQNKELDQYQNGLIRRTLLKVFEQCPSQLDQGYFAIVKDASMGAFIFISSDGKFVPLCKRCNFSVYVSMWQGTGKILCGNKNCKKKIIGQFQLLSENEQAINDGNSKTGTNSNAQKRNSKVDRKQSLNKNKRNISVKQKQMIEKAAKKVIYY